MNSVYLIHAKTKRAKELIAEEGAVPFTEEVFLHNEDPLNPRLIIPRKTVMNYDDFTVVPVFVPNHNNEIKGEHPEKEKLKSLLQELHTEAFHWPKDNV